MTTAAAVPGIEFSPRFATKGPRGRLAAAAAELDRVLVEADALDAPTVASRFEDRWSAEAQGIAPADRPTWSAALAVLIDLRLQGWGIAIEGQEVAIVRPSQQEGGAERTRRRQQLAVRRTEQLQQDSVRDFVRRMESPAAGRRGHSIFDLMTDGPELSERCGVAAGSGDPAVRPVLVPVRTGDRCPHTGIDCNDIWRYFRHTWTSPYESVPGRSLLFLVRDAAHENAPVMGIAALSSAAVKQRSRDAYIGWTVDGVLAQIEERPRRRWEQWIHQSLADLWDETFVEDLVSDGILNASRLTSVKNSATEALRKEAKRARDEHHAHARFRTHAKATSLDDGQWLEQAQLPLFRSKRCERAVLLLELQDRARAIAERGGSFASHLTGTPEGRRLVEQVVRLRKAGLVGTCIADLTVCGAVPPYNELNGGKLVAMLAISPAAVDMYRERYEGQTSVIASAMAGRTISRPADLAFVGTSSLYGMRPNQYDRAMMPLGILGGTSEGRFGFRYLGQSEGYGVAHIRKRTKEALKGFMEADGRPGWRANNIFGEGANPNMRALREAFGALGLDAKELLMHSQPRAIYGASLAENLAEYAIGLENKLRWVWSGRPRSDSVQAIGRYWWERWASPRAERGDVQERMRSHTLTHPITHGARIELPEPAQTLPSLFDDLA